MGVNIIETNGPETTETIQQRSDKSSQRSLIGEDGENGVIIPRNIYLKLGNRIAMQRVTEEKFEDEKNEFHFFIMEMQRFQETGIDVNGIAAIDEYLGTLGLELEYPFDDDAYVAPELPLDTDNADRNVVYDDGNTIDNVTYYDTIVEYNVIHEINH